MSKIFVWFNDLYNRMKCYIIGSPYPMITYPICWSCHKELEEDNDKYCSKCYVNTDAFRSLEDSYIGKYDALDSIIRDLTISRSNYEYD